MSIIHDKYYIIRKGDFATNGNTKILYSWFDLFLIPYLFMVWIKNHTY